MSDHPLIIVAIAVIACTLAVLGGAAGRDATVKAAINRGFIAHDGVTYSLEPRPAGWGEGGKDE